MFYPSWFLPPRPTKVTIYTTLCRHFLSFFLIFRAHKESWDMWGHEGSCASSENREKKEHLEEPFKFGQPSMLKADNTPYSPVWDSERKRKSNYKNKTLQDHQLWRRHLRSSLCSLISCLTVSSWCFKIKFTSQMKIQSVSTPADGKTRRCSSVVSNSRGSRWDFRQWCNANASKTWQLQFRLQHETAAELCLSQINLGSRGLL